MSSIFTAGKRYPAVFTGEWLAVDGVMRPVYEGVCGEEGARRLGIPTGKWLTVDGVMRSVYQFGGCVDGEDLTGKRVVGIPTGKWLAVNGVMRPVYLFACCPGSSSSSSSSSSSGSSQSQSGSGSGSSSSSVVTSTCLQGLCGDPTIKWPATLLLTVSGSALGFDGTYPITSTDGQSWFSGTISSSAGCPLILSVNCLSFVGFAPGITSLATSTCAGIICGTSQNTLFTLVSCNPPFMTCDTGAAGPWNCDNCCPGASSFNPGNWTVQE